MTPNFSIAVIIVSIIVSSFSLGFLGKANTNDTRLYVNSLDKYSLMRMNAVITARIRRMTGGYIFSLSTLAGGGGGGEGTPSQVWVGGGGEGYSGYPPWTRSGLDSAAQRVRPTRRAVCLLRSRRRTFL